MDAGSKFILLHSLKKAVLFLVFNRNYTTKQVFKADRKARQPRIYFDADSPRIERPGEDEKVREVRDCAINKIEWVCEIKLFSGIIIGLFIFCKWGYKLVL